MEKEIIYTTNEVAEMLRVTPLTIRRLVGNGKLKACKVGRVLRFRLSDIETYLNGGSHKGSKSNSIDTTEKAIKFKQLAGKWEGAKDGVEAVKRSIKESKSEISIAERLFGCCGVSSKEEYDFHVEIERFGGPIDEGK